LGFHVASAFSHLFAHKFPAPSFFSLAADIVEIIGILLNRFFAFPVISDLADFFFDILYLLLDLCYFKDDQLKMDNFYHFHCLFFELLHILVIFSLQFFRFEGGGEHVVVAIISVD